MKQQLSAYIDTSVVGAYYDTWDERRRELTREFWGRLREFSPHVSSLVLDELAAVGKASLRNKLIRLVAGFKILPITGDAHILARKYLDAGVVVENF